MIGGLGEWETHSLQHHPTHSSTPRDLLESQPDSLEHVGSSPGSGIECQGMNNSCLGPSQVTGAGVSGDRH